MNLTLRLSGMSCASCTRRVEAVLAALPDVAQSTVNLATETDSAFAVTPVKTIYQSVGQSTELDFAFSIAYSLPNIDAPMTESSATLNGIEQRLTDVEANNVSLQAVFDTIWPVGSIYFSEYNIGLPAHFINYGTWAAIASDRRLIRHVDFSGGPNSSIGWTPGANALSARNVRGWVRTA